MTDRSGAAGRGAVYDAAFANFLKRANEMATPRAAEAADMGSGLPSTHRKVPLLSNDTASPSTSKKTALGSNSGSSIGSDIAGTIAS